jgi:heat-inducible transcriptional repressor
MAHATLSDREQQVLEAVIRCYVETAEPAGSRTISRRFGLGVSPATIRNTMADLEEKGFLYHPHTSAGRIPTDKAYRFYVDGLMRAGPPLPLPEHERLAAEIGERGSAIETILRRAAQSLGVLTQELGVALGPRLDHTILTKLELVRMSAERLILVLTLRGGAVRTIFVEIAGEVADDAIAQVQQVLNERLAGLSLTEIRRSLGERLRDAAPEGGATTGGATELLNIFVQEGEQLFDVAAPADEESVLLGQASVLAEKPEFASGERLRQLITLTETRTALARVLRERTTQPGVSITIGDEHGHSLLGGLTLVTAEYTAGSLTGVIGVIGPTRMPYEKVITLVSHASSLVNDLLT